MPLLIYILYFIYIYSDPLGIISILTSSFNNKTITTFNNPQRYFTVLTQQWTTNPRQNDMKLPLVVFLMETNYTP